MEKLNSDEVAQLVALSKTARFLKKNNLKKLEESQNHLHDYTLSMKDEDLEYEWRLDAIQNRKKITLGTCVFCIV